jgi:hypothetical protein
VRPCIHQSRRSPLAGFPKGGAGRRIVRREAGLDLQAARARTPTGSCSMGMTSVPPF